MTFRARHLLGIEHLAPEEIRTVLDLSEKYVDLNRRTEKKGDVLVSESKLPEGDGYNVVVQFKQTAESKPQNFRFKLDMHTCSGTCKRAEYACTCDE